MKAFGGYISKKSDPESSGIWSIHSKCIRADLISYEIGLTDSLLQISGNTGQWTQQTIDISAYAGATARFICHYVSGSNYTGDFQIDDITFGPETYTFESDNEGFGRSSNNVASYVNVNWESLATGTLEAVWNRDSGNTPSGSTGNIGAHGGSYHVYTEVTSSGYPSVNYWLRSPQVSLGANPTLVFWEGRDGATIGTANFYLDIIS